MRKLIWCDYQTLNSETLVPSLNWFSIETKKNSLFFNISHLSWRVIWAGFFPSKLCENYDFISIPGKTKVYASHRCYICQEKTNHFIKLFGIMYMSFLYDHLMQMCLNFGSLGFGHQVHCRPYVEKSQFSPFSIRIILIFPTDRDEYDAMTSSYIRQ